MFSDWTRTGDLYLAAFTLHSAKYALERALRLMKAAGFVVKYPYLDNNGFAVRLYHGTQKGVTVQGGTVVLRAGAREVVLVTDDFESFDTVLL